ncbi:TlpA family protein disulfide reductase [Mucilaginibacter sp. 14171R-50]|uniref:TlpA family protein disulfide reductase n=1 Tax=Mucilaginibacter sp. 14171R-50 TaxID=2703789 RepID=UPI00138BD016|nr:TlpA disulfide reductase family protein [Mucilaginibacter sp. 14171R-50]QHS55638.1 TlpA family protein disulfide reductase [Mucilaginibacter sp. 14171R-50]
MRSLLTGLLLLLSSHTFAQFKLTGKVIGTPPDSVHLNMPFVYGYYTENTIPAGVNANGYFNKTLNISGQRFATININGKEHTLLLTPGKSLDVTINMADTTITGFKGVAAKENKLLYSLGLEKMPFFFKDTLYARLSLPELKQQVLQKWFAIRDEKLNRIEQSDLPAADKKLIIQEVRSGAIVALNDFARGVLKAGRKQVFDLVLEIYKDSPLAPEVLPAGPKYYAFANSYISYLETLAFKGLPDDAAKNPQTFVKYYNVTIDSGTRIAKQKGKSFLQWMLVRNEFDKTVAEHWLAQAIETKLLNKDLPQTRPLLAELQQYYPRSSYLPAFKLKADKLEKILAANAANKEIVIADGFEKMTSVYEAIKNLKGKIVYLDIWGTWCGPCKEELKYNAALKSHFKGKDVAFVYLDMDDDAKDAQWREFIKVNGLTGLHLRKSNKDIQSFWNELKPGQKTQYYPTYFIFDKNGALVKTDAKRPSDLDELYKQIEGFLNDDKGGSN